jgi:hypothetical protein
MYGLDPRPDGAWAAAAVTAVAAAATTADSPLTGELGGTW